MRALITGAAGFVGRWLTRALREEGVEVTGIALKDEVTAHAVRDGIAGDAVNVRLHLLAAGALADQSNRD